MSSSPARHLSFFDLFPAPTFLEMPAPGLALSDYGIRLVEFTHGKAGLELSRAIEQKFPSPALSSGIVSDREGLVRFLSDFRAKHDLLYVRATLPEERGYLFAAEVPSEGGDLRAAVEAIIEENVPLTLAESVFDYSLVREGEKDGRRYARVSVSVVARTTVEEYLALYREAGFEPLHFDIESQAAVRAMVSKGSDELILAVLREESRAVITIAEGGCACFSSVLTTGLGVQTLAREAAKVAAYWADKESSPLALSSVSRAICYGSGAEPALTDALAHELGVSAAQGNVWNNAFSFEHVIPDLSRAQSLAFASAAGLALPHGTS
jgi:hypothetical protein